MVGFTASSRMAFHMRRRWKALVAVGAFVFVAVLFFLPPRDDGLDWVRKYGGQEEHRVEMDVSKVPGRPDDAVIDWTEFDFSKIPEALIQEISKRKSRSSDTKRLVWVDQVNQSVLILDFRRRTWLEKHWFGIKQSFGWK
jgi:hypothetical protein